jgi:Spx/MgsR family transcriptional regulator
MVRLYGISTCDSVRKARKWLEAQGIAHNFHDFRKDGLDRKQLERWVNELGWEALLNRRGTTWRKLPESARAAVDNPHSAIQLMLEHPTLLKRPLLELGDRFRLGFSADDYSELFLRQER